MFEIRKITGRDNERLKYARRVRDGREDGKIFLEGSRLVEEAVRSGTSIESIFVSGKVRERFETDGLSERFQPGDVFELSNSIFQSLADTNNAQGIIAIASRPETTHDRVEHRLATSPLPLVVFLHEVNNPSNLGAVIRTTEAAGAAGVFVSTGSADPFSPKALRAAMGSSLRLPICTNVRIDEALTWAKKNDLQTVAADVHASAPYTDVDWTVPRMLVLGSEAHGLSESELVRVDGLIVIPFEKDVESLNLAVACGVILFEARRQTAS